MFKDTIYQNAIDKFGYALFPFLEEEHVKALQKLYNEHVDDGKIAGMYANHNRNEVAKSKYLSEKIIEILQPKLREKFNDFTPFISHFVVKAAQSENEFALHQDWNIVDEKKFKSYHIWMPLDITHRENGGMFVVPGSHHFFNNHRSGSLGTSAISSNKDLNQLKEELIIPRGNALAWHGATFHGSFPNSSEQNRISVVLVMYERKATTHYYHLNSNTQQIDIYPLTPNLLLENLPILEIGNIPNSWEKISSIPNQNIQNTQIRTSDIIREAKNKKLMQIPFLSILKHESMQEEIAKNGFVLIKDFLDDYQLLQAKNILNKNSNFQIFTGEPRYTSMERESPENKVLISNLLEQLLLPSLMKFFKDFKCPVFQFFIKMPHSDGEVGMHTDTTLLLNPAIEPHYGIWIPLQDVDENNGTLMLAKSSHQWFNGVLTSSVNWPFFPYLSKIEEKAIKLNLKAGELVVFDNRLIHGSTYNASEKPRLCVAGRVTHQYSQYYSFFKENPDENLISVYEEADDFYLNEKFKGDKTVSPTGKYIGKIAQPDFNPKNMEF